MKTLTENNCIFYQENGILVRRAVKEDAKILAPKLSAHDVHEAWAVSHLKPLEALELGLNGSILAMTIEHNNIVIAMCGIIPDQILGNKAQIWFLASDELKDIGRIFLRNAKGITKIMLSYYNYLYNYVHADNLGSIAWMRYCGFQFAEAKPFGVEGELFHYFYIEDK